MGVIRYLGETDFAKGEWCGVELDEPLGKNDGAVAGTRYPHTPTHTLLPVLSFLTGPSSSSGTSSASPSSACSLRSTR